MVIAELVLKYVQVLIWPLVAVVLLILYRDAILSLLGKSKIKLSLFGVTIETTVSELETTMMAPLGGTLTDRQWDLLRELKRFGLISVADKGFVMSMSADLDWIRPVRNAGLIMTLPDGKYIEQAEQIKLTRLGELLMQSKQENV